MLLSSQWEGTGGPFRSRRAASFPASAGGVGGLAGVGAGEHDRGIHALERRVQLVSGLPPSLEKNRLLERGGRRGPENVDDAEVDGPRDHRLVSKMGEELA